MKRRLSPVAAIELLLIAVLLLAAAIVPGHTVTVPAEAFDYGQSKQVSVEDGKLTISAAPDGTSGYLDIAAYGIRLRPGAYEIRVDYDSDTDGRGDFYACGATLILDSNRDITTDYINLNDSQTTVYGRVWVPLSLRGSTDTAACVSYLGKGTVVIAGLEITEVVGYRF
ncbi:MAG: hypothetical protein J6L72_09740, partial [Butyricicoccus sp.]|nr:hypothetical protein [Butyricicoccus sp.]